MLTTRVHGSRGSVLQRSPKEKMTHCSGTFIFIFFFNHPHCTEVGEFQCVETKNSRSISLPQTYEICCIHFHAFHAFHFHAYANVPLIDIYAFLSGTQCREQSVY